MNDETRGTATQTAVAEPQTLKGSESYFADFDFSQVEATLETMLKSGVHFGHMKSRRHPRMEEYIYTTRNNINILDLQKTLGKLETAAKFLSSVQAAGKSILFVATKKQAVGLTRSLAERLKMPYMIERWLGGTFTNFKVIRARAKYLKDSEEMMTQGEFKKYTKLEQLKKTEELQKLEKKMGGIKEMTELPGAIFITDVKETDIAIREAVKAGVPVAGIVDTNADPGSVDYPIPANDDAVSSLRFLLSFIGRALAVAPASEEKK